jgi:hypothetical protein
MVLVYCFGFMPARHLPADVGRLAWAPPQAMTSPARASNWISRKPIFASQHGFLVAIPPAMWRYTLVRLRNMPRWESSPVDVQCTHTKRFTRPVPDPAGPAAAEPVTGTGTDAMITDATAASSSVLVTDIIACVPSALFFLFARASPRVVHGTHRVIRYTISFRTLHPLHKVPSARFEMPRGRDSPVSKKG